MKFEADKNDEGNFKPATVKLSFKNNLINKKLCTYMKALEIRENMLNAKNEYSEEEYADSLQHINENRNDLISRHRRHLYTLFRLVLSRCHWYLAPLPMYSGRPVS